MRARKGVTKGQSVAGEEVGVPCVSGPDHASLEPVPGGAGKLSCRMGQDVTF
jgi:hypothetical protein